MDPIQNSNENRLQLLESFIEEEGLADRLLEFERSREGNFKEKVASGRVHYSVGVVDRCLLDMYFETKELIAWFDLSAIVGCLSDLASDHLFTYNGREQDDLEEAAIQSDALRGRTQLVLGLIKYLTSLNRHVEQVEYLKGEASGHLFSKYPDLPK